MAKQRKNLKSSFSTARLIENQEEIDYGRSSAEENIRPKGIWNRGRGTGDRGVYRVKDVGLPTPQGRSEDGKGGEKFFTSERKMRSQNDSCHNCCQRGHWSRECQSFFERATSEDLKSPAFS